MAKKDYHAQMQGDTWVVMGEGNKKASSKHVNQKEAWAAAMEMAKKSGSTAFKHGKDDSVKEKRSFGA
ncbi:MAG: DUF2188 domain-containing protein [candidate division WS1 bacterium]|jgi:hypothetical protein|nr:DUF2188 domain-containing protein [candidate division WS1 bacterium]